MPPRVRPPAEADAEAVLEVIVARDVADLGVPDFTLEDLRADWAGPGAGPRARRARGGRRTARSAATRSCSATTRWLIVHPDAEGQGIGTVLRRWAEARAARARHGRAAPVRLRLQRRAPAAAARGRLRAGAALLPPARRPRRRAAGDRGARCAPFEPRDEAAVHALIQDAFAEIEGHEFDRSSGGARRRSARTGTTRRCGGCSRTTRASRARRSASAGRTAPATSPSWRSPAARAGAASGGRCCSASSRRSAAPGSRTPS